MNDNLLLASLIANFILFGALCFLVAHVWGLRKAIASAQRNYEVRYHESVEDNSGALKNSKKFVMKGQVYVDDLPIGGQFLVSEHIIEEFSYEKLSLIKRDFIQPLLETALAFKTGGATALNAAANVMKAIKPGKSDPKSE